MWTVVRKELRGYFNSATAVIFLAAFLAVALYTFFWQEKFFARGLADLRPLFNWMPRLLIILVSALAMRLWAEERRAGTLEILLTLPVPRWQLVLGKFIAGMLLIATGLGLTLGLPITIAQMGSLDLGPVVGGYLAALLLSAAYLSIGMCVSAATDNQIVAFVGTALACGVAYIVGELGEVGRLFGTGARFESVARGVLDVRDLAYYGGIFATGIALNVLLLQRPSWGNGPRARSRRIGAVLTVALVAANALALDLWLAPVRRARIDLTQDGTYSLSPSTETILARLDEPLLIRGYFSEKTHPRLAPLLPQVRELLEEYRIAGHGKVRLELVDPSDSADAKREAKEQFGIESRVMSFASTNEKSWINAYFAIAIVYGDQQVVLQLGNLINQRPVDVGDVEVTLGNVEYEVTKSILKAVADFSSLDTLFASATNKIVLTQYVTPSTLPENWKEAPQKLQKAVDKLKKRAGDKLELRTVEPKTEAEMQDLFTRYGVRPYQDALDGKVFYFHMLLQIGDQIVRIVPPETLGESELAATLNEGLKRGAPGFTRVVGLWQPPSGGMAPPMMEGMPPQEQRPPQTFGRLQQALSGNYEVHPVTLDAPISDDVDALVLAGPADLDAKAAQHVDQFVMRGGALVVLAGRYRIARGQTLSVEKVKVGLEDVLSKWGVTLGDELVLDEKSEKFPIPDKDEIVQIAYPYFVKMDGDQIRSRNPITGGLVGSVMHFASPVKAELKVGDDSRRVDALLRSSSDTWLSAQTSVMPDLAKYPGRGFPLAKDAAADKRGSQTIAVAVIGGLTSAFATPKDSKQASSSGSAAPTGAPRLLEHSPPDARVVVFGSSAFVSDDVLQIAQQLGSDLSTSNVDLVHNAVDWALGDSELLSIRAAGAASHALTVAEDSRSSWRTGNLVIALVGLLLVVGAAWLRRRSVTPLEVS